METITTVLCVQCGQEKNFWEDFYLDTRYENPTRASKKCKKCTNSNNSKHRKIHSAKYSLIQRNTRLKKKYNIDIEEYNLQLIKQNYICGICGCLSSSSRNKDRQNFSVDHNHKTEKVRGLLCSTCNTAIAWFEENPQTLNNAIRYLENDGIWD